MFEEIGSVENIPAFLLKCKNEKETLLYGFGHRVFKSYDPRAKILKKKLIDFRSYIDAKHDRLLDIALALEE